MQLLRIQEKNWKICDQFLQKERIEMKEHNFIERMRIGETTILQGLPFTTEPLYSLNVNKS